MSFSEQHNVLAQSRFWGRY